MILGVVLILVGIVLLYATFWFFENATDSRSSIQTWFGIPTTIIGLISTIVVILLGLERLGVGV